MSSNKLEIGIDIGGTFTDVVCRAQDGSMKMTKIMSTRSAPEAAVMEAINYMTSEWGVDLGTIHRLLHGTTVATNAVLERRGACIGLLTTKGFGDILEIGRQMRSSLYGLFLKPETPVFLAQGQFRKGISERVGHDGVTVLELDESEVLSAVQELVDLGVQSIAVCYLFSFKNPAHEIRTREIINASFPSLMVSISSDVDPSFREYERTVITAFDAYMKPVIGKYMERLERGLVQSGVNAPLQVMQSRGGLAISTVARNRPVRLFMSGPAAGAIGGAAAGLLGGERNVIAVDIGGTSCDITVIQDGQPAIASEGKVDGFSIRVPMVDVSAIGSGGGSIAWIDSGGGLRVGPASAGAEPGPAAYDRGGQDPTVADAAIVLGYLNPKFFANGTISLNVEKAKAVIWEKIAGPLGLTQEEAAQGILRVVNAQMAEGIRLVSIKQGLDPRNFALVPLGGAGPLHATDLADELGITKVIVPKNPGVLAAVGLLSAPIEHETSAAFPKDTLNVKKEEMIDELAILDQKCTVLMKQEGVESSQVTIRYYADMLYKGQSYFLQVPLNPDVDGIEEAMVKDFAQAHDQVYGFSYDLPTAIVNLRSVHTVVTAQVREYFESRAGVQNLVKEARKIYFVDVDDYIDVNVYDRTALVPGVSVDGPAIVEQTDTTTLIGRCWSAKMLSNGTLVIEKNIAS